MANITETMLIYVDSVNNNNKFYHVTLDENGVVTKRWGRVGTDGTVSRENTGRDGYERVIRAKEKKGYRVTPVNATHVTTSTVNNMNLESIAQKHLTTDPSNSLVAQLISRIVSANKHQIMEQSGGQIKVSDDGLVRTALGIVNQQTISQARFLLLRLMTQTSSSATLKSNLEDYLTLIPQDVGRRRGWDTSFLERQNLQHQQDFLTQLESSVQWYDKTLAAAKVDAEKEEVEKDHSDLFRMRLGYLDKADPRYKEIERVYMGSRNMRHNTSRSFKLVNVFTVEDEAHEEVFNQTAEKLGNIRQLWHGTSVSNVLSILTKGLFIPKSTDSIQIAGRMFGDALYFSSQSSKSLNYSNNYWHGGPHRSSNCFMFFNDIVMGNEFRPARWDYTQREKAYRGKDSKGRPYNSIYVKGGTCGVLNDEMMVWNTDQIKLKYLCEFAE